MAPRRANTARARAPPRQPDQSGGPPAAMAFDDDDQVLQNAEFGLAQVEFKAPKRAPSTLSKLLGGKPGAVSPAPSHRSSAKTPKKATGNQVERLFQRLLFYDAVVTMILVPLRIGFFFDPFNTDVYRRTWTPTLTNFAVLDLLSAVIKVLPVIKRYVAGRLVVSTSRRGSDSIEVSNVTTFRLMSRLPSKIMPEEVSIKQTPSNRHGGSEEGESLKRISPTKLTMTSKPRRIAAACAKIIVAMPWELGLCLLGEYNLAHFGGLLRFALSICTLPQLFSAGILKQFRSSAFVRSLTFSTVSLVFHSTWTGLYLCHLAAAGYMFIAHVECGIDFSIGTKYPVPGCWVLKDQLERGTVWRQYVRTMYWASKTITTLGQGDLVPTTDMETNYCICIQFISGLWATACLSACGFVFSRRDANMRNSTATHFEQSLQFLSARKSSPTTVLRVMSYFRFIQRSREGVDESSVLGGLPTRYRAQCSHQIKHHLVKRIPFFRKHEGAFLRAILDGLQQDFFSSEQTIVDFGDVEELLIVSTGEVRVSNSDNVVVRRLLSGNYYADQALSQASLSQHRLVAETPSEIWWLTRRCLERTVENYFPAQRRATILGRRASSGDVTGDVAIGNEPRDVALRKLMDKVDRDTAKSVESVASWRLPSSQFRIKWRAAECICLLYVAIEVPIHIAFNRDFGLLDSSDSDSSSLVLKARFVSTFIVELFFYFSWYFRACVFVRRATDSDDAADVQSGREDSQNLIVESKQIFRHYLEHEDLLSDAISNAPVALVWDVVAKKSRHSIAIFCVAFFRLSRLFRLRALLQDMKFVMTRRNLSPPTQMLVLNCVVCVLLANAAASVYYAVGGFTMGDGSIVRANSAWHHMVSASSCLSDASVFGNCTWFQYDFSEFGIESAYLRSLHWSLVLLSTVGYGDILAFSNVECIVGFFWIYAGAIICYFTASAVSSVISNWQVLHAVKNEMLEDITRTLLSFKTLSPATISIIQRYYVATWKMNGSGATEGEVLDLLPKSLRSTITRELYSNLRLCRIFADSIDSPRLVEELAGMARALIFLAGVNVMGQGLTAHEAFVIQSGAVELYAETDAQILLPQVPLTDRRQATLRVRRLSGPSLGPHIADVHTGGAAAKYATTALSIAVLRKSDMFGEESFSYPDLSAYALSGRTLATTQVIVLHRDALLGLRDRYPTDIRRITTFIQVKVDQDRQQLSVIHNNFLTSHKLFKVVGLVDTTQAEIEKDRATEHFIIHPESTFAKVWSAMVASILLYNFYQIVFRLAFLPRPTPGTVHVLNAIDYTIDAILAIDMLLKWNHFGYTDYSSGDILDRHQIRQRYQDGWLKWDVVSMVPLYFPSHPFKMAIARLPRLLKSPQLIGSLGALEEKVHEHFINGGTVFLSVFDMVKFLLFFLSAAHHLGSCYYLLGRVQLEYGIVTSSWITADAVLSANPDRVDVHYFRSVYWCLETFTVVCFGDVIARNAAETVYASATCIMGWVFIGQIIGKMTSLVLNLDKEAHDHIERVNDFEEYAKRRSLPLVVRERAKECAEYKSKTILEFNARNVLKDLPTQLRLIVFDEAYGNFIRDIPEFDLLSRDQVQALASAFTLEIYMRRDVIFTEGRVLTRLYIMKEGRGELFSAVSSIVLASIHEGVMFGDTAFFIPGVKNIASARAHTSCQVLQLERHAWKSLWPDQVRRATEEKLVLTMREKYRLTMESYLNVMKNFELSRTSISQRPMVLRRKRTLRSMVLAEKGKLERQLLVCYAIRAPKETKFSIWSLLRIIWATVTDILDRFLRLESPQSAPEGPSSPMLSDVGATRSSPSRLRFRTAVGKVRPSRPDKETLWSRHANKLRVLRMLDVRKVQAEADLNAQSQRSRIDEHGGIRRSTRTQTPGFARRKSTGAPTDMKQMADASGMSNMSQNPSGTSSRSSREDNSSQFRRHSIQLNHDDILKKLEALREYRDKDGSGSPANRDPAGLLERPLPSRDSRTHSAIGIHEQLSPMPLKKGKSAVSLLSHPPTMRLRSNSFHELLAANGVRRRVSVFAKALGDALVNVFKSSQSASHLYGIWSEPPQPPPFVLEGSGFRRAWDVLMLAICLYYVLVVPFRASFDYEFLCQSESKISIEAWFVLEYAMDGLCWIDFLLHKEYFAFVYRGEIVTDSRLIRDHYFRKGTYVIDLLTLLPLEVLAPVVPSFVPGASDVTWYHIAVLRLNKILRIVHLHDLSERLQQMLVYDFKLTLVRRSFLAWIRFSLDFVLGAHWVACFAYAVAFNSYEEDGRSSWLTAPGMLTFAGCDGLECIGTTPVSTRYARSYHFSMGAITTVSYGDIAPLNPAETCATIVVIIASIVLFGMLSGGFFQLFEMEIGRRADYEQRVARVAQYMQFHRFQSRMWKQMQVYFAVHWAESKGMNEDALLRGLTTSVKQDIAFFVMEDFVKNMKLFATAEPAFARAIISAFQQELFVRNDIIICEGDTERSLYVIESGLVSVRITKKATLEQIEVIKGRYEFIGEKSLIFNIPRSATCVALCACSVLILTLERYEKILEEFPDYREKNAREWMFTRGGARPQHALKI